MFLIRQANPRDLDLVLKLAKTVHFINLPADKDVISSKIGLSERSFRAAAGVPPKGGEPESPIFMFMLEDTRRHAALGTSSVVAQMGGPGRPNLSFELRRREFFSQDLQTGTSHITAKLYLDESGPTEIGALILGPSFRGHPAKLGKQLSLIRFHYIGLHRELFTDHLLAEMMAPVTPDGQNVFWEHLGRRFINLPYDQADRFCAHSREFMLSLLPREEIYLSLLPPVARQQVGAVGVDTIPARRMLEDLGFSYVNRIDPFDGGPHLEAEIDKIEIVRNTTTAKYGGTCAASQANRTGFISTESDEGEFRATYGQFSMQRGRIRVPAQTGKLLQIDDAQTIGVTEMDLGITPTALRIATPEKRIDEPPESESSRKTRRRSSSSGKKTAKKKSKSTRRKANSK